MPAAAKKTPAVEANVDQFVAALPDAQKRADAAALVELMRQVTKLPAKLWPPNMIGFGDAHQVSASGRAVNWYFVGFAARPAALTLFALGGWPRHAALLIDLGPNTLGGGDTLLPLKRLSDVKLPVLKQALQAAFKHAQADAKKADRTGGQAASPKKKK